MTREISIDEEKRIKYNQLCSNIGFEIIKLFQHNWTDTSESIFNTTWISHLLICDFIHKKHGKQEKTVPAWNKPCRNT